MDKRWKQSQFHGLPAEFVMFAKRVGAQWNKKKNMLVDQDGEPVAWLLDEPVTTFDGGKGIVAVWHPQKPVFMSTIELRKLRNNDDLRKFQGTALILMSDTPSSTIEDVIADTASRLSDCNKDLNMILKERGTIGKDDVLKKVVDERTFYDVFENVSSEDNSSITITRPTANEEDLLISQNRRKK